jgi:hypothetical protein
MFIRINYSEKPYELNNYGALRKPAWLTFFAVIDLRYKTTASKRRKSG